MYVCRMFIGTRKRGREGGRVMVLYSEVPYVGRYRNAEIVL